MSPLKKARLRAAPMRQALALVFLLISRKPCVRSGVSELGGCSGIFNVIRIIARMMSGAPKPM